MTLNVIAAHSDDHRLFDERHDRHLRSGPREPALDAARFTRPCHQRVGESDARPNGDHVGHGAALTSLALFFFGGEVLHGFAFTMVVGIITGTYSSVFIAAAIVSFWRGTGPTRAARARRRRPPRSRSSAASAQVEAAAEGARLVRRALSSQLSAVANASRGCRRS